LQHLSSSFPGGSGLTLNGLATKQFAPSSSDAHRIVHLPKEVGMLLLVAGLTGGVLPPPPGPSDLMIMLSGGLVLWPRGFLSIGGWVGERFPIVHRAGMGFLDRFLVDLERRYPNSTAS
jgi:hypothetical protein